MQPKRVGTNRSPMRGTAQMKKKNVSLEIQSDSKNYVSVQDDEIPSLLSLCIL